MHMALSSSPQVLQLCYSSFVLQLSGLQLLLYSRFTELCHFLGYSLTSLLAPSKFFVSWPWWMRHTDKEGVHSEGSWESSLAARRACLKLPQRGCLPWKAACPELLLKTAWLRLLCVSKAGSSLRLMDVYANEMWHWCSLFCTEVYRVLNQVSGKTQQ